jgi:DNA glycosylase AlkZ-like
LTEVVRAVCGLQAQLLSAAELAVSARVSGVTRETLKEALWIEKTLVRAWTVRGTIHVVPADDFPIWVAALGSNRYWESKEWLAREGLTAKDAAAIFDTVIGTLSVKGSTRTEIADAVVARLGKKFRPKIASMWGDMLGPVTYMGKLCFGPSIGANVTFVRADRWIGQWRRVDRQEAWRELVRRFLRAYGPTPLEGVVRWFGIEAATALSILRSLEEDVTAVRIEGRDAWMLAADRSVPRRPASGVRLLAQYDCYVIGSHPRETVIHETARTCIRSYKRGRWEGAVGVPVLLLDGVVSGVWERRERAGRVEITVQPAVPLTAAQRKGVYAEGERIARFFGRDAVISLR